MKSKILIFTIMLASASITFAQNMKVNSAFNFLTYYLRDADSKALVKAQENIDEATVHESTKSSAKTWYYRGWIYHAIGQDSVHAPNYESPSITAYESYVNALKFSDNKFREKDDLIVKFSSLTVDLYNNGIESFRKNNFLKAYEYFSKTADIKFYLIENELPDMVPAVRVEDAILNAARSAEAVNMRKEAKALYRKLLDSDFKSSYLYARLATTVMADGDTTEALKIIQEARTIYPDSLHLLIDEINIYLRRGQAAEIVDIIQKAIELDKNNPQLYFVLSDAYKQMNDLENELKILEEGLKVAPADYDLNFATGAFYFNKTNDFLDEMNNPKTTQKRYEELVARRKELYIKARDYFEIAYKAKSESEHVLNALREVYAKLDDMEKSNFYRKKLEEVRRK